MSEGEAPPQAAPAATDRDRPARRRLAIRFAALMRWLHIYTSMFGLAAVLFFGATGLTLNHPSWFLDGAESSSDAEGRLDREWLGPEDGPESGIDKLAIVEALRARHGVRGALGEFRVDGPECSVSFRGPGYSADAFIDRATGTYRLNALYQGPIAVLNDLHKGRDSGPVWSLLIDVSAVGLVLISVSGLVLLFYLKLRRSPGLVVAVIGTVVVVALALLGVP